MKEKRWVQHISGQGEKWELSDCPYNTYEKNTWVVVHDFNISSFTMELPRAEYRLCDPPEQWEDVTADCDVVDSHLKVIACKGETILGRGKYRLRKVHGMGKPSAVPCEHAFIVERKVQS